MKKIITLLLLLFSTLVYSQQTPLKHMLKTYFRIHPFDMKFTTFILNLQKDPWFSIQEFDKRTDTTFFYLGGSYKNFNPFRFIPSQIKLVVSEQQVIHVDSLHTIDTIVALQILALSDTTAEGKNNVIKEFKRFHNNEGEFFYNSSHENLTKGQTIVGEVENYFVFPLSIAPVTVAWGSEPETNQFVFVITVRFKLKENLANYIAAPWEKFNDVIE
jgi:hypothetical protein